MDNEVDRGRVAGEAGNQWSLIPAELSASREMVLGFDVAPGEGEIERQRDGV